jgi:hypothetical protein
MSAQPARVAVAAVGDPESPETWSGTTAGVLHALRELGVSTTALDLTLAPGVEQAVLALGGAATRNRFDAQSARSTMRIRTWVAQRRVAAAGFDGIIQIGTTFSVGDAVPYVTLEDMTLRQGMSVHPVFGRMSPGEIAGWERRRAGIYARARSCTAASHWAADSLLGDYGVPAERVAVVGLGANHSVVEAGQARAWEPARFLFVGVDWQRKGGPLLLRAFSRLRETHPDAALDVVGGHPRLDLPGVSGHGMLSRERPRDREQLAGLFGRASCLVMPSEVEPFGIAHIEAASAGLPSIGSSVGGPRDIIGSSGGLLVDPGDEQGLLEAMRRLADPQTARQMGAAAQERSRLYTWPKVAERLLRVLGLQAPDGRVLAETL